MEAVKDFIPFQDTDRGTAPAGQSGVDAALAVLRGAGSTAAADAALRGFRAASDFAGTVEELARFVEYLQLVAADAVDRTRKQPSAGRHSRRHLLDHRLAGGLRRRSGQRVRRRAGGCCSGCGSAGCSSR